MWAGNLFSMPREEEVSMLKSHKAEVGLKLIFQSSRCGRENFSIYPGRKSCQFWKVIRQAVRKITWRKYLYIGVYIGRPRPCGGLKLFKSEVVIHQKQCLNQRQEKQAVGGHPGVMTWVWPNPPRVSHSPREFLFSAKPYKQRKSPITTETYSHYVCVYIKKIIHRCLQLKL